jgi:hypothetical protein
MRHDKALDSRLASRTSIYLTATLVTQTGMLPVRIRNLSECGALVEGAHLPWPGAEVRLERRDKAALGHITWADNGRAGILFAAPTQVLDWSSATDERTRERRLFAVRPDQTSPVNALASGESVELSTVGQLGAVLANLRSVLTALQDDQETSAKFTRELELMENSASVIGVVLSQVQRL